MNENMNKNWYAVITADVLYDKYLTPRQKLLVAIISNLSNEKGYCFANNTYLAELSNCSVRSVQRDLTILENKYIGRVVHLKPNGEVDYRALTPMTKTAIPHVTDDITPSVTDDIYNNKYINKVSKDTKQTFSTYHFKKALLDLGANEQHLEDWMKVRRTKKASNTQTALNTFINECRKYKFPVSEAVKVCAQNDWKGFKYEWIKNKIIKPQQPLRRIGDL